MKTKKKRGCHKGISSALICLCGKQTWIGIYEFKKFHKSKRNEKRGRKEKKDE